MRVAAGLLSLVGSVLLLNATALAQQPTTAASAQPSPAAQNLARCVQRTRDLSVLFLIDESGSLQKTDRDGQRVAGLKTALSSFLRLAESSDGGTATRVDYLLTGFAGKLDPSPDATDEGGQPAAQWASLSRPGLNDAFARAERFRTRDDRRDTDYATALAGARKLLAAKTVEASKEGRDTCAALVFFTDGRYEIKDRVGNTEGLGSSVDYAPGVDLSRPGGGERAVEAGREYLCRPDGLMDGLVADGITKFTVALSTSIPAADRSFLQRLTTGSADGLDCGTDVDASTGDYVDAETADCLFFTFGSLLDGGGCNVVQPPVCEPDETPCERGQRAFRAVPGLSGFRIRATTGGTRIAIDLRGPRGGNVRIRPGDDPNTVVDGARVTAQWVTERAVELSGAFDASSAEWVGAWVYSFIDESRQETDAVPSSHVQLLADLQPRLVGPDRVVRGQTTMVRVGLARADGTLVRGGPLVDSARLAAAVTDPTDGSITQVGVVERSPNGLFAVPVTIAADDSAGTVFLDVEPRFDVAEQIDIASTARSFPLRVVLPPGKGYPEVRPSELRLPSIEGAGTASGTVTVIGSSKAGGCVRFGAADIDAPPEAGTVRVRITPQPGAGKRCVRIGRGERRAFTVEMSTSESASSRARAQIPIALRSDLTGETAPASLEASAALLPEENLPLRWALVIGLTLLGVLIPLAVLHGLNVFAARFTPPQLLRYVARPAVLTTAGGLRSGDGGALQLGYGDQSDVSTEGEAKGESEVRLALGDADAGTLVLKAVPTARLSDLFRGPFGRVVDDARTLVGSRQPLTGRGTEAAPEVPLNLPDTWVFVVDDQGSDSDSVLAAGTLVVLVGTDAPVDRATEIGHTAAAALSRVDWSTQKAQVDPRQSDRKLRFGGLRGTFRRAKPDAVEDGPSGIGDSNDPPNDHDEHKGGGVRF